MSSFHNLAVDVLAHPKLLSAREQVRKVNRWGVGIRLRAQLRVKKHGYLPGVLSIIVPAYGVERFIDECLRSLSTQNYRNVEVIVVDDGSPDRSYDIAHRWSLRDPRFRVVRQANAGLSAARNTGVRHARGEYIAFLDSDDFVDRHSYMDAVSILEETGSDFAVLPYRRELKGSFPQAAPWIRAAHNIERKGTTVQEFPDILVNAVAWSKVYRHEFWDKGNFEFPVGLLYEDQALSMKAFARAENFDVLSRVSINWRMRDDQSSITQQLTSQRNIHHHHIAVRDSLSILESLSTTAVMQERLRQILNNNLGEFLPNIRQMDDGAWAEFVEFIRYLVDQTRESSLWNSVDARKKILIRLVNEGNRTLALRFLEAQGWQADHFAGSVQGNDIIGEFPLQSELSEHIDESSFRLSLDETALYAVAREFTEKDDENLELTLIAYINRVRPRDIELMRFEIVNTQTGQSTALESSRAAIPGAVLGHTRRYADMKDALYRLTIPRAVFSADGEYEVSVTAGIGNLTRTGRVTVDWKSVRSTAIELEDERVVVALRRPGNAVKFRVTTPTVVVEQVEVDADSAQLTVRSNAKLSHLALVRDGDRFSLNRSVTNLTRHSGLWTGSIRMPKSITSHGGRLTYDLRMFDTDGAAHTVYCPLGARGTNLPDAKTRFVWARRVRTRNTDDARGNKRQEFTSGSLTLVDKLDCLNVTDVRLEATSGLVITCQGIEGEPGPARATAHVGSTSFDLPILLSEKGIEIHMPLEASRWGRMPRPYPSGDYTLTLEDFDGSCIALDVHDSLALQLPRVFETELLRVSITRGNGAVLGVHIEPSLSDEEAGGGNRWRMKDWFYTLSPAGPRSVLFRNLYGEAANDSALAVHHELRRRGSPLELIWAVKDHSVEVPADANVVVEDSRPYYEAFGTANYVMVNVHQPDWYVKREGQVLIETFHGYPFKLNGYKWWQRLGFAAERQESFFRRASEWDYLVSPASYATPFLKEFYRPDEEVESNILEIGYPRNDALLAPNADQVRERVRHNLGIRPDQKAVLYAPTFRDYVSSDDMSAAMVEFVDLARLTRALGHGYVVLLRGHPFNAREGTSTNRDIINVTDYPDINDLILASDLAVLDYSSLRFDYALTGKPSIYYVPDYERYFAGRESFVPYGDTTPGPLLQTGADLTEAIKNAESIARSFESQRKEFVSRFMELEDGRAAERLVDAVFAPRGDA